MLTRGAKAYSSSGSVV